MLKINGKEMNVISASVKYANSTYNKVSGYSPLLLIQFLNNGVKGYISFYFGFYQTNSYDNLKEKKIISNPTYIDAIIDCVEIFDTEKFIDFIDSEIVFTLGEITENKMKAHLKIDDEIKVEFNGLLDIC